MLKRNGFRVLAAAALAAVAGPAASQDGIDAATIYRESCSVCHGDDGRGAVWGQASLAVPPRNFTTAEARRELTRERMIASVTAGRPGTPMPGFATQLDPAEIAAVVDHIRGAFMQPGADPAEPVAAARTRVPETYRPPVPEEAHALPLPGGLEGDADRGRAYYMANCVDCHGAAGGGDGPRAYFIFPKPRNFNDPATRAYLNRPNLYRGIDRGVIGREMPAWGKVMSDQQIADIAEFVYREFVAD